MFDCTCTATRFNRIYVVLQIVCYNLHLVTSSFNNLQKKIKLFIIDITTQSFKNL